MDEQATHKYIKSNLKSKMVFSDVLTITPGIAETLLNLNWPENRPIVDGVVERYAASMRHHNWKVNGEAIIIADDGQMIDGQHRLFACVEANTPFDTVVMFGVEKSAVDTIDCGRNRSLSFRSGIAPAPASALNFILKLGYGKSESNEANLRKIAIPYGNAVHDIIKLQTKRLPILRQGPLIAAGAIWYAAGQSTYVSDVYRGLIELDASSLPPIGKSFLHQCIDASHGTAHRPQGSDLFVRAFKVFDPSQSQVKRLQYKEGSNALETARTMILKAMNDAHLSFDSPIRPTTKGPTKRRLKKG